jgi:hypothetical protein
VSGSLKPGLLTAAAKVAYNLTVAHYTRTVNSGIDIEGKGINPPQYLKTKSVLQFCVLSTDTIRFVIYSTSDVMINCNENVFWN